MELLYIIRNCEENNKSILGVYTTAKFAKKAIEYNERLLLEKGYRRYKDLSLKEKREIRENNPLDYIPRKEVKVVLANGIQYRGCSAYSIDFLLDDPKEFERKVKEWFEDSFSSWQVTIDELD